MAASPNSLISPDDIGLRTASLDQLRGGDGDHNARYLALLEGETGPYHDVVLFNARRRLLRAVILRICNKPHCRHRRQLTSGKALAALNNLIAITNDKA